MTVNYRLQFTLHILYVHNILLFWASEVGGGVFGECFSIDKLVEKIKAQEENGSE
jgi:hypothetical protein